MTRAKAKPSDSPAKRKGKCDPAGVCGQVEPVAAAPPAGAVGLQQLDEAAHGHGREPAEGHCPGAYCLVAVAQHVFEP